MSPYDRGTVRPRTSYRVSLIAQPVFAALAVLCLVMGAWVVAVLMIAGFATMNRTQAYLRGLGVHWNSPNTFQHFRQLQAKHKQH